MPQWLGGPELIIIVLVIVIVFGWKKLPDAARSLGRSMRIFKAEVEEMKGDKPSAASRDTVAGEARHEHPTSPTSAAPRDGETYVSGGPRHTPVDDPTIPRDEDQHRPPTA